MREKSNGLKCLEKCLQNCSLHANDLHFRSDENTVEVIDYLQNACPSTTQGKLE